MRSWIAGLALLASASAAPAQLVSTAEPTVVAVADTLGLKPTLIEGRGDNVLYSVELEAEPVPRPASPTKAPQR